MYTQNFIFGILLHGIDDSLICDEIKEKIKTVVIESIPRNLNDKKVIWKMSIFYLSFY